jgi:hypothetical protein
MKYKTKTLTVDAVQWESEVTQDIKKLLGEVQAFTAGKFLQLPSTNGTVFVSPTDWVVKHADGSITSVKNDVFQNRYEKIKGK